MISEDAGRVKRNQQEARGNLELAMLEWLSPASDRRVEGWFLDGLKL